MPIIIHDFDVVLDPPQESERAPAAPERSAEREPTYTPLDLHDVVERERERRARLRAH